MLPRLVLLLMAMHCAAAQVQTVGPEAQLQRSREAVSIRDQGPFSLIGKVKYSWLGRNYEGGYKLVWINDQRWHEEIQVGDYRESRTGSAANVQVVVSPAEYRFIGDHLRRLIAFAAEVGLKPGETMKSHKSRHKQNRQLDCILIRRDQRADREVCLDEAGLPASTNGEQLLSDFRPFGNKKFPFLLRQESLSDVRDSVAEIQVTQLVPIAGDTDVAYSAGTGSREQRGCFTPAPAEVEERVRPTYPVIARQARISGAVVIQAVVDENGKVAKGFVVEGHPMLRDAVIDALKRSRFKPATCDGVPVEGVIVFTSIFTLGG
jgi:TonB family protein